MHLTRRTLLKASSGAGLAALSARVDSRTSPPTVSKDGTAWPQYRHGPARTGTAVESRINSRNVGTLTLGKSFDVRGSLGEFLVSGTTGVTVIGRYGVSCRELPSLRVRWRRGVGAGDFNPSTPVLDSGVVYSTSGLITATRADDGSTVWNARPSGIYDCVGSPAVSGSFLYVTCRDGTIAALNTRTGKVVWSVARDWHTTTRGDLWAAPAIWQGKVYVGTEKLGCFDAVTGAPIFVVPLPLSDMGGSDYTLQAAAVADGVVVVPANLGVSAFDARTGESLWALPLGYSEAVALSARRAYVRSATGLHAVDVSTGSVVWSATDQEGNQGFGGVTLANGVVFSTSEVARSMFACQAHDALDGRLLWTSDVSEYSLLRGVTVSQGRAYVTDSNGTCRVYALPSVA